MKTFPILAVLLATIFLAPAVHAGDYVATPAPDTFRGLKWGTPLADIPDLLAVSKPGFDNTFFRKNESLKFGDADITSVAYYFRKDKLYRVGVAFSGRANHFLLKDRLIAMYGAGRGVGQRYGWMWPNFSVELDFNDSKGTGALYYTFEGPLD